MGAGVLDTHKGGGGTRLGSLPSQILPSRRSQDDVGQGFIERTGVLKRHPGDAQGYTSETGGLLARQGSERSPPGEVLSPRSCGRGRAFQADGMAWAKALGQVRTRGGREWAQGPPCPFCRWASRGPEVTQQRDEAQCQGVSRVAAFQPGVLLVGGSAHSEGDVSAIG